MMTTYQKKLQSTTLTRQSGVKLRLQSRQGAVYVIRANDHYTERTTHCRHLQYTSTGDVKTRKVAISNFNIVWESNENLNPGDEISGKVVMDVWSTVQIKYVELLVIGRGNVRVFSSSTIFVEKPRSEVYINKRIQLIGPKNGGYFVTLPPGRYISAFKYTLPDEIPPSVHQNEMGRGVVFDISYYVQANVCDNVGSKLSSAIPNMTKIIKAVRKPFTVIMPYDWKSFPGATEPIVHKEQVSLMCSSNHDPTCVTFNLSRGVYAVGDAITILTQVHCPERRRVQSIKAELEQQLTFDKNTLGKYSQTLVSAQDDRHLRIFIGQEHTMRSQFKLHVPKNIVPSYLPNCHLLKIEYNMKITVSFKKLGGKLVIWVPLMIMPYGPEESFGSSKGPIFNKRVMKFHQHSMQANHANGEVSHINGNEMDIKNSMKGQITTKYEPAFHCLGCCLACLGIGIYDS